jgi:D-alanyl-D-alanine carboxypeptidase
MASGHSIPETSYEHAPSDGRAVAVRAHLEALVRRGTVPGVQYVVVGAERPLFDVSLGVRDVATGAPMEPATRSMAYSVTKAITAIAAMQLVERGALELDRSLDAYYPRHPYGREVTIRSLLAQTSGVPSPMPLDWFEVAGRAFDRDAKLEAVLARHPRLRHRPGERYAYSNLSYWLLEKAIEAASGEDFGDYLRDRVFARVGIDPREIAFEPGDPETTATGCSRRFAPSNLALRCIAPSSYWGTPHGRWSRIVPLVPHGRSYGGLFASARTLAAVLQDLLRGAPSLLARATIDAMLTQQRARDGRPVPATLGWVPGALRGARYFGEQGGGLGFHGNVRIYPDHGIATVLLANRTELTAAPIDARSDAADAIALGPPS